MCFKLYDVDDSGAISKEELFEMLASVTLKNEMLAAFDRNQPGELTRKSRSVENSKFHFPPTRARSNLSFSFGSGNTKWNEGTMRSELN